MGNGHIRRVFEMVFGEKFNRDITMHGRAMQGLFYVLQQEGVHLTNYGYSMYGTGIYSTALTGDIFTNKKVEEVGEYVKDILDKIDELKKYVEGYEDKYTGMWEYALVYYLYKERGTRKDTVQRELDARLLYKYKLDQRNIDIMEGKFNVCRVR